MKNALIGLLFVPTMAFAQTHLLEVPVQKVNCTETVTLTTKYNCEVEFDMGGKRVKDVLVMTREVLQTDILLVSKGTNRTVVIGVK